VIQLMTDKILSPDIIEGKKKALTIYTKLHPKVTFLYPLTY